MKSLCFNHLFYFSTDLFILTTVSELIITFIVRIHYLINVQNIANAFWKRWKRDYLSTLTSRQKWLSAKRNLKVNDIVLVVDDTVKRNLWPLGVVTEIFTDQFGHVRRVNLRKSNGNVLQRDVRKLCLLEAAS